MSTTNDVLLRAQGGEKDAEWLHQLLGDWQLLADLSFGDLALWVRTDTGWQAAAQVRPTTGFSVFPEDLVGTSPAEPWRQSIERAAASGALVEPVTVLAEGEEVVVDARPVRRQDEVVAVMSRHLRRDNVRRRGRLESTYLALSDRLLLMVAEGTFPDGGAMGGGHGSPRVGDGVVALDATGCVTYASPNAVSAFRRLGVESHVVGLRLATVLAHCRLEQGTGPEEAAAVLAGSAPWHAELRHEAAAVAIRSVPLVESGTRTGAALLLRDTTELRRRDRELLTKDATIREIHHRVKNNLQTVAAVLRLQSRRLSDEDARRGLDDAGRRVAVIAAVHDSLSEGFGDAVDFDEVAARGLSSGIEVARRSDARVESAIEGSFGVLASEDATSVALILGELVQNAVEHGLGQRGGRVVVTAHRDGDALTVEVRDDGAGLGDASPGHAGPGRGGLGSQIVTTFVRDLHGEIAWLSPPEGGAVARFTAQLRPVHEA